MTCRSKIGGVKIVVLSAMCLVISTIQLGFYFAVLSITRTHIYITHTLTHTHTHTHTHTGVTLDLVDWLRWETTRTVLEGLPS